jgi:hypothetical protein
MSTRHDALTPYNKLYRTVLVETVDGTTGATTPIVSGTVTAFIVASTTAALTVDKTAADASLSVSATHVGVASPTDEQFPLGTWLVVIPASTPALLDALFPTGTFPWLIVVRASECRVYEKLHYARSREAVLN